MVFNHHVFVKVNQNHTHSPGCVVGGAEEVKDLLVVQLEEGDPHGELRVLLDPELVKDLGEGPGDDAGGGIVLPGHARLLPPVTALHREGLARAGLSIGEHGTVVALHHLRKIR